MKKSLLKRKIFQSGKQSFQQNLVLKTSKLNLFFNKKTKQPKQSILPVQLEKLSNKGVKVFGPNPEKLAKESIFSSLSKTKEVKRGKYGLKTLEQIKQNTKRFDFKNITDSIKLWAIRIQLARKFNKIVAFLLIMCTFLFVIYLIFFDTYFLVKDYNISFNNSSFLDEQNTKAVISSFETDKFLGFIPNNQFWFLNDQNLTNSAQKIYPDIISVKILDKIWPNKANIEITTEPILVTLGINSTEYWRVSQDGKVLSTDEANLRENLVVVTSPITLTFATTRSTQSVYTYPTFKNYSFLERDFQINRFWFIIWLWEQFKDLEVEYVKTSIPSLSDFDSDVIVTTNNNTEIWFDINSGDRENIRRKMELIFTSSIIEKERRGEIKYIDFRTPKRVFVCPRGLKCDK